MANIKITEMPQATTVSSDNIIPVVQDGVSKQTTADNVVNQRENLSNTITYTTMSGITVTDLVAYKINNILYLQISFSMSSNSNRVIEILTITNISNMIFSAVRLWKNLGRCSE